MIHQDFASKDNTMVQNYKATKKRSRLGLIVLFFFSFIELIISITQIYSGASGRGGWPLEILLATLPWLLIYFWISYRYHRSVYLFSNAYLLCLALFHLSLIYMLAIGQVEISSWTKGAAGARIELAGWYVVLAFGSFGIGTVFAAFSERPKAIKPEVKAQLRVKTNQFIYIQGFGLSIVALLFFILALKSYGNILAYSRAELFNLGADSRGFGVFLMVFPGAITLLTVSARTKKQKFLVYPLAILFFLLLLLSGYRSIVLFPALIGVILWVKTGRKIPLTVAIPSVVFVLMAIAVIGIFRQMGTYEKLGSEQLDSSYEQASIADSFAEMGASVGVLSEVLRLVPKKDSYRYGYSYWISVKEMVPNIGWSIDTDKSRKNKLGATTFNKAAFLKMKPADWITYRISRWKFDHGQGVGFSAIAEPYLNFGMVGVIGYFALLGFILMRLDLKEIIYHPYIYLFAGSIYWTFMRTVRNDFTNFTKPMGFIIIILLVYNVGLKFIGRDTKFGRF